MRRRSRPAIAKRFRERCDSRSRGDERTVVPFFGEDDRRGLQRLHQHRMLAVGAAETVGAIVGDGVEFVELVFAQTFGA